MKYTGKTSRAILTTFIGITLAAAFNYGMRMYLARQLTTSEYGLVFAAISLIFFVFIFMILGLNVAFVKFLSEYRAKKNNYLIKQVTYHTLILQTISAAFFTVLLYISSDWLAENYFHEAQAGIILKLLALALFLLIFDDWVKRIFHGYQRMDLFSVHEALKHAMMLGFVFLFFYWGYGILSVIYAYIVSILLISVIMFPFAGNLLPKIKRRFSLSKPFAKKLLIFSLPILLMIFAESVMHYMDTLILTYFRPLSTVGIYNAVLPTAALFFFFSRAILLVMTPLSAELWAKKAKRSLRIGLVNIYKYFFVLITPLILTVFIFAETLLRLLFGEEYTAGAWPLRIILIGVLFFSITKINSSVLTGIGKPKIVAKIFILAAGLNLILNFALIPKFGMLGAATATSISYILAFLLSNEEMAKEIVVSIRWRALSVILVFSMLFAGIVFVLKQALHINPWFELGLTVLIAGSVYLGLIFGFKIIDINEVREIFNRTLRSS